MVSGYAPGHPKCKRKITGFHARGGNRGGSPGPIGAGRIADPIGPKCPGFGAAVGRLL
jgi:hypothetical protein